MRGPESTFGHHIRWSSGYNSLSSLLLASIGWHHYRTRNAIGPRNWSTVMWPAPIGWWCRVSPAIYTTLAQDLRSVVVDSSLACLAFGRVGEHTSLYWQYGTLPAAAPTERDLHSVYCLGVSPTSPEVWSARWCAIPVYRVQKTCNKCIRWTRTETVFVLFLSWDLKYTGLMTNLGPVPFVPWGTSWRFGRSKNIHNEKASIFHSVRK